MSIPVGILGIATALPPEVRKNDWWPTEVVERWRAKRAAPLAAGKTPIDPTTPGGHGVLQAMAAMRDDPFHGARERRVVGDTLKASDLELQAAREAIAKAGINPSEIGAVFVNTVAPDYLVTNNACLLHHNLELSRECFTMQTEVACNAFLMHLALAQMMIQSGQTKYALLVQTSNVSRLLPAEEAHSPWFGDACAATIVGRVSEGRGLLSLAHRTVGEFHRSMVGGVRGGCWTQGGKVEMFSADHEAARRMFFDLPDSASDVANDVLAKAGFAAADVDFFAPHQATAWMRPVLREHLRLTKARSVDTFSWAASVFGANIPLAMSVGEREGTLREGDLVLMFAGGAGTTYSGILMRWGR